MSTSSGARGRTRPTDDESSSEDDETQTKDVSQDAKARFRSRVSEYANKAEWPREPLYQVNEVVYVAVVGQQLPAGPFVIVSSDYQNATYVLRRQDNGQTYPNAVPESSLRVLV
ncbi:hypothetical protein CONLIGDRAFT_97114 [Coniochaeta ligniaria NRRL 30616]|uniref:Uncharacterized protein n=1 Tax=Coniochaeta ligniaria NRRL 30616 TaxID=1408157 RepID=A0A1J7IAD2_9PEZI|nr:hypothetical protein CONLIGDRAFT_97114 [Coniochaeta ligniaria NRRL 30616]